MHHVVSSVPTTNILVRTCRSVQKSERLIHVLCAYMSYVSLMEYMHACMRAGE